LSTLVSRESGLCLTDTRHEVARAVDVFRFAAIEALHDDGEAFPGDVSPNGRARRAHTLRLPVSLVAAITPFNHPLNQAAIRCSCSAMPISTTPPASRWTGRSGTRGSAAPRSSGSSRWPTSPTSWRRGSSRAPGGCAAATRSTRTPTSAP
jgi:hypothetical protein